MGMDFFIAVIKGDGIGPEIVDAAIAVLDRVGKEYSHRFKYEYLLAGGAALDVHGEPLPKATVKKCKNSNAALLGAVGDPKWDNEPGDNRPEKAILGLREELGLFANLRPAMVYDELSFSCPLKEEIISGGLNILIVRELTGGIYFGPRGTEVIGEASKLSKIVDHFRGEKTLPPGRFAYDVEQYSEMEISRIATTAFEMAMKREKRVTSVDKANVLDSSRLWRAVMEEVHVKYPEVKLDHLYVDNTAQQLIKNPKQFDVIVTSNMFGDILSDEASQITGSIGMLPSASLGEGSFGLYEPIHGSAPKYAGMDRANPIATILSAAMMLRYSLNLKAEADAIEKAVNDFLVAGYRTPDIHTEGKALVGTKECGNLIAGFVGK
ncbi:MAG: 3-isopropylmalate dehydrogenase [Clostridiales Family XIII bacterium]|jgi:3-isopropylmalate dehydrogenase|nr:3-isopropylmalate dehydrogenase [Clostridiales Family XIII bacterium]